MNWQAVSFDWNQVRAFLATTEQGSLSAAAQVLNTTQPTVGRQVSSLERDLGVTLFERAGRTLVLTSAGIDLLEHVQAMGDAASKVSMIATSQSEEIAGTVSITASDLMCAGFLLPALQGLRRCAPALNIEIVASNRLENLTRRDADIAIRHVRPEQPDLIARHLADFTASFYASSDYVDRNGAPKDPSNLAEHVFIGPRDIDQMVPLLLARGLQIRPDQFKTRTDSAMVMWELMRAGMGIAVLPDGLWPDVEGVERVLEQVKPIRFPVWIVTHQELRTSRRIRTVFDALAASLVPSTTQPLSLD